MAGSNDIRRIIERSFEVANVDASHLDAVLEECYADDYVVHDPSEPQEVRSRAAFREFVTTYRQAFPDLEITIDGEILVQGDTAACHYTVTGTHTGDLLGIAPTNRRVSVQGMEISTVRDGKLAETWQVFDTLGMLTQVGAVPSMDELSVSRGAVAWPHGRHR